MADLQTGATKEVHSKHSDKVLCLEWNKEGLLISAAFDSKVVVWDTETSSLLQSV